MKHIREAIEAANTAIAPYGAKLTDTAVNTKNHIKYGIIIVATGKQIGHLTMASSPRCPPVQKQYARQQALRIVKAAAAARK
jgi:hypothetical protein